MLAEELFYRAGGLVRIKPILEPGLMLHGGAGKSTRLERLSGYAEIILDDYGITQNDCLILISNSGGNSVLTEAAQYARRHGIKTVALTSINHSTGVLANNPNRQMLFKLCNVVLDNCGCYGDACVSFGEKKAAPTSTVIGAMILNALVCLTVEKLEEQGIEAEIFKSSNTAGGNDYNKTLIGKYKMLLRSYKRGCFATAPFLASAAALFPFNTSLAAGSFEISSNIAICCFIFSGLIKLVPFTRCAYSSL